MADTTICTGESLALSILACTTREQIQRVVEHALRIKDRLSDYQRELVKDAIGKRTQELAFDLQAYSAESISKL